MSPLEGAVIMSFCFLPPAPPIMVSLHENHGTFDYCHCKISQSQPTLSKLGTESITRDIRYMKLPTIKMELKRKS